MTQILTSLLQALFNVCVGGLAAIAIPIGLMVWILKYEKNILSKTRLYFVSVLAPLGWQVYEKEVPSSEYDLKSLWMLSRCKRINLDPVAVLNINSRQLVIGICRSPKRFERADIHSMLIVAMLDTKAYPSLLITQRKLLYLKARLFKKGLGHTERPGVLSGWRVGTADESLETESLCLTICDVLGSASTIRGIESNGNIIAVYGPLVHSNKQLRQLGQAISEAVSAIGSLSSVVGKDDGLAISDRWSVVTAN